MRASPFDFIGNLDTLLAVMIGALLATLGALVAEMIQDRLGRRRRQREAARFFGEVLLSINEIFDLACESRNVGEPWGIYTQKLYETAEREGGIYLRNRERLFDICDMALRFDLHRHMLRLTGPISTIVQQSEKIDAVQARLDEDSALTEQARAVLVDRRARLEAFRAGGLSTALEARAAASGILKRLEPLAGLALKER